MILLIPPSIDLEGILNLIKISEAFMDRFPTWHSVKTSLFKLSCFINSKCDFFSRLSRGIDVRENKEFNKYSIRGSISIPLNDLEQKSHLDFIKQESLDKEVFTLCQVGKRSEKASKILIKFKIPSKSIEGGIKKINQIIFS